MDERTNRKGKQYYQRLPLDYEFRILKRTQFVKAGNPNRAG
jgi:hypothetical protein